MRSVAVVVLTSVALSLGACGGDEGDGGGVPTGAPRETIEVTLTEFRIEPATVTLDEPGIYRFRARNDGTALHALRLRGEDFDVETSQVGPGRGTELSAELEAGTYELICPVLDHADRGMKAEVSVG